MLMSIHDPYERVQSFSPMETHRAVVFLLTELMGALSVSVPRQGQHSPREAWRVMYCCHALQKGSGSQARSREPLRTVFVFVFLI